MNQEPCNYLLVDVRKPDKWRQSQNADPRWPGKEARVPFQNVRRREIQEQRAQEKQKIRCHDAERGRYPGAQADQHNSRQSTEDEPGELPAAMQVGGAAADPSKSNEHQDQGCRVSTHQ